MFHYSSEVKPNLRDLLKKYGPKRGGYATDIPFWRLRHDEFWSLKNAELCSTNGVREPREAELTEFNVSGGFDTSSYSLLQNKPAVIDQLAYEVLNKFIPREYHTALIAGLGFERIIQREIKEDGTDKIELIQKDIEIIKHDNLLNETMKKMLITARIGQGEFRRQCLKIYPACPVTGINFPALLRASHIKPWADCKSSKERLDPYNGIMLAAHIDALFDEGWISFTNQGAIIVSNKLDYHTCNILKFPATIKPFAQNSFHYLDWHREKKLKN